VLNPRIVAVWFCDDGENNSEQRYAKLHTDGFSFTEVEILVNKLKKMGITNCNVYHKKGAFKTKECPAIRIGSSSYLYFLDMIREFIPTQDVLYKVDISHYIHPIKMFGETHPLSLLNESQVLEIAKHLTNKRPIAEIASEYNVSPTTIGDIYNGKNWGCLNLNLKKDQDIPYNNNSGFSGVSEYKNGLWRSRIQVYYTNINLGHYKNKQDAITIRKLAEQLRDSGETNPEKFKQLKRDFQEKLAGQKNGGSV
jgi:hypothetical protein